MTDTTHDTASETEIQQEKYTCGVRTVMGMHLFIASQIALIFNLWEAIIYTIMPVVLFNDVFALVRSAPFFALLCITLALMSLGSIRKIQRSANAKLTPLIRMLIWIALSLWLPVAYGDGLRWMLMKPVLSNTPQQCRGSVDLFESMQRKLSNDGLRMPHAWIIRNGQPWLWSYRSLRFEPAPDWTGAQRLSEECPLLGETRTAP